ncbi:uncharacterized protein LOC123722438 [Papilio machaon]|uniref:uncharacterized protein LOC123722438 n=1 Tax=Papilio machaon TaxID=76193 RepID=UPI001E664ABE|nr:uncharacterized protein LOC123722438 [Papilio machaon]
MATQEDGGERNILDNLKVQRSSIKGKLTRIYNYIQNYDLTNNIYEIKARQSEVDRIFQKFDEVQSNIELFDYEDTTRNEQERSSFENKYFSVKARIEELLCGPIVQPNTSNIYDRLSSNTNSDYRKPRVKLPQLELPKFDGDIRQWPAFKNIFMASVDNADIPVVNKLQYLKTALTGEAAGLISSLLITEENYVRALDILNQSYCANTRLFGQVGERASSFGCWEPGKHCYPQTSLCFAT